MNVQLLRIDDRLIHGQVIIGWAKPLKTKCILLCDNEIAQSEWERDLYLACVPDEIKALVYTVQETVDYLNNGDGELEKTILLVKSPEIIIQLLKLGYKPDNINLGGLHYNENRVEYLPYIYLNRKEVDDLKYLLDQNIIIDCQDVPTGKKYHLKDVLLFN